MAEYLLRRNRLLERMKENSIAIIYSGVSKITSEDDVYPFVTNRNFYYLTGIKQEDSILVLIKGLGESKTYLFIQPYDPVKETWTGRRITPKEASDASSIENVYPNTDLASIIDLVLGEKKQFGDIETVYLDLAPEIKVADEKYTKDVKAELVEKYSVAVEDVYPILRRMRMVKSEEEISEMKKAIDLTNLGLNMLANNLYPGVYEFELANKFNFFGRNSAEENLAFTTIAASGKNATCLHYHEETCAVKDGDLILFDLGFRHNVYCSDISRTYPVNGEFSPIQKKIYEIVLGCNKSVIAMIKEGLTIADLQSFTVEYLKNECIRNGLMKPEDDIRKYYMHGVSHHLGLDTHDISDRSIPLEAGNVITVEPGLYFSELGIGVRIEDDVLVTKGKAEVLSSSILKEVKDIERLFKTRKR